MEVLRAEEELSPCECVETTIHVVRNIDDARRIFDRSPGRALIHADFAAEEIPKIEGCLLVDLSDARERLRKVREVVDRREEAKALLDLAWSSFMRTIRKCAER